MPMKSFVILRAPRHPLPLCHCFRRGRAALLALLLLPFAAPAATWQTNTIEGWTVLVNDQLLRDDKTLTATALDLLRTQLQEIARVVPAAAVARLREVPLWFSPEYPGVRPRAEYHPGAGWLRANGRNPDMVKAVEFTNVRTFAAETRRMPNFALHELAHAYHDRVLGNGHAGIKAAYEQAKAGGKYDRVERQDSEESGASTVPTRLPARRNISPRPPRRIFRAMISSRSRVPNSNSTIPRCSSCSARCGIRPPLARPHPRRQQPPRPLPAPPPPSPRPHRRPSRCPSSVRRRRN